MRREDVAVDGSPKISELNERQDQYIYLRKKRHVQGINDIKRLGLSSMSATSVTMKIRTADKRTNAPSLPELLSLELLVFTARAETIDELEYDPESAN